MTAPGKLTPDQRRALRAERAALDSPFERIAFDNRRLGHGLPLGLVLMAFEEEDATRLTVDGGQPCTLEEFFDANPDLPEEDAATVRALRVGEGVDFGGGAAASMPIVRVA